MLGVAEWLILGVMCLAGGSVLSLALLWVVRSTRVQR